MIRCGRRPAAPRSPCHRRVKKMLSTMAHRRLARMGSHLQAQAAAGPPAASPVDGPYTTGSGAFRYSYCLDKMQLPEETPGSEQANGHGVAIDNAGRIYYTFDPALPPELRPAADMGVFLRWPADGSGEPEVLGPQTLAAGRPHGLYHTTENGEEFMYHTNDGKGTEDAARVIKTTLEGDIVWDAVGPPVRHPTPPHPTDP